METLYPNIIYHTEFSKITLHHVKTTILYFYLEQELHNNEIIHKACVPLRDFFFAIEISIVMIMSERYFISSG